MTGVSLWEPACESRGCTRVKYVTASRRWSPASALAETIGAYDTYSGEFAAKHWEASFAHYLDEFIHVLPKDGHPVVDAGCGAGRDMAAMIAHGFPCIGVDLSAGMLAQAQARVRDPAATWLNADIRAIPLEARSAVGVWTSAALLHLDEDGQQAALREFRRLLPRGGPLFVSTLAGSGVSVRRSPEGLRRWFWSTELSVLSKAVESLGFQIVSAKTEAGVVRGDWVNILAVAR